METLTTKFFSFLFLTAFGGGWTVPLGLPPAKEDPVLARVAPEKCLFYASWAGTAPADAKSKNQTEQLLAEPEVQRSIAALADFFTETVLPELASCKSIGVTGDPSRRAQEAIYTPGTQRPAQDGPERVASEQDAAALQQFAIDFATIAGTHPGAIYFDHEFPLLLTTYLFGVPAAEKKAMRLVVRGGFIVATGPEAEKLRASFKQLVKHVKATDPKQIQEVKIAGKTWYRFPGVKDNRDQPPIVCGFHGTYFIVGAGDGSVEAILARFDRNPPEWLAALRKQLPIDRMSTVVYLNTKLLFEEMSAASPMPKTLEAARKLGLDKVTAVSSVSGLDSKMYASKLLLSTDGEPCGLLNMFSGQPLKPEDLKPIPRDSTLSFAAHLDPQAVVDQLAAATALFHDISPADGASNQIADAVTKAMQPDFRRDLPKALGDTCCIYSSPSEGGLVTAVFAVKDQKAALAIQLKLVTGTLAAGLADSFTHASKTSYDAPVRLATVDFDGHRIFAFPAPLPAWCLTERELIVAPSVQNVMAYLKRPVEQKSLTDVPQVGGLLTDRDGPSLLAHIDTLRVFELAYPLVPVYAMMMLNAIDTPGKPLPPDAFPSFPAIRRHLLPGTAALRRTKHGLELTSRQPLPGTGLLWTTPIFSTNARSLEEQVTDEAPRNKHARDGDVIFEPADTSPDGNMVAPQPATDTIVSPTANLSAATAPPPGAGPSTYNPGPSASPIVAQPGGAAAYAGPAVGVPAIPESYRAFMEPTSEKRLREVGDAIKTYRIKHDAMPPAYLADKQGKPLLSWRVAILPCLGQKELYNRFKLDEPWDSPHNRQLAVLMPEVYREPVNDQTELIPVVRKQPRFRRTTHRARRNFFSSAAPRPFTPKPIRRCRGTLRNG